MVRVENLLLARVNIPPRLYAFKLENVGSRLSSPSPSSMKIPLTGVQLFIARRLRHWIVTGAIFAGHRLKWLGESAEAVSGLEQTGKRIVE